jgi:hypothetical protein
MDAGAHPALRSCGIGTVVIQAAEQRIRARGLHRAELGVEDSNPRARSLYERLGYAAYGSEPDSWDQEAADGTVSRYETMLTLMRKELPESMAPVELRPADAADSEFCYQLHKAAMGGYITATWGWDEQVQLGFHARAFDPGHWQIITVGGADAGMLNVEYRPGEIYLARIEVHPDYSEVDTLLGTERMQSKLAKLADSGKAERHLFLVVLQAAFSLPVHDSLAWGGPLPGGVPQLPDGLSQLWLLTGIVAGGVVRAVSGQGWHRDDPYGTIDINALKQ